MIFESSLLLTSLIFVEVCQLEECLTQKVFNWSTMMPEWIQIIQGIL